MPVFFLLVDLLCVDTCVYMCVMLLGATGAQASPTWQSYVTDISPTVSAHTVTGLRPAQAYQFRVSAVNAVGKGEASAPSAVIQLPEQRKCHISMAVLATFYVLSQCL